MSLSPGIVNDRMLLGGLLQTPPTPKNAHSVLYSTRCRCRLDGMWHFVLDTGRPVYFLYSLGGMVCIQSTKRI